MKKDVRLVDGKDEDGVFWIEFDDLKKYFAKVQISKYNDSHIYSYSSVT